MRPNSVFKRKANARGSARASHDGSAEDFSGRRRGGSLNQQVAGIITCTHFPEAGGGLEEEGDRHIPELKLFRLEAGFGFLFGAFGFGDFFAELARVLAVE